MPVLPPLRTPMAACDSRVRFVRPAMLFHNLQLINIYVISFIHEYLKVPSM